MCGITGVWAFNEKGKAAFSYLEDSVNSLRMRGPDRSGTYIGNSLVLGHTRLSVIDTSDAGTQPLSIDDGEYTIVFNGEIFNYQEHRSKLQNAGVVFKTATDTEVLLQLYKIHGYKALELLNGFFSCAIFSKKENSLFICRDRFGKKPLHIYKDEDKLIFASEMKGVLAYQIPKEINKDALHFYFQLNYLPQQISIFEKCFKLLPGEFLLIKDNKTEQRSYYTIDKNSHSSDNYETAQAKVKELVESAVVKRLVSDVPIGTFLSGGIDSSIVSTIASRHTSHLNTFSIGYKDEPFFDETYYANLVAKKIKSNHTVFSLSNDDLFQELHNILDYIDEPFADSSAIAVYILSKLTKKHVTVALSGDGADELFSGYNKHQAHLLASEQSIKNSIIRNTSPLFSILPKSRNSKITNTFRQLHRYSSALRLSEQDRYWQWCSLASADEVNLLLKAKKTEKYWDIRKNITRDISSDFNSVLNADLNLVLCGDMLTKTDLMSMANGLEIRSPFLDYELVNYVSSLPSHFKILPAIKKRILQDTFRKDLPSELYNRSKHGFEVPLLKWFKTSLHDYLEKEIFDLDFIASQGIFDPEIILQYKKTLHSKNPNDIQSRIWALIVFQNWYKKYYL